MSAAVFFYISGHGFGHAIRQIEIINSLLGAAGADVRVVVRTDAPAWLFTRTLRRPCTLLPGAADTGVVQIDSLRLDEAETIRRAAAFYAALPQHVAREQELLTEHGARLVVADAPPLACAAAAAAGVPAVVCGNFTWDWIYGDYEAALPQAAEVVSMIRQCYRLADAGWRLPMHGGFAAIRRIVDVPFVARHPRRDRSRDDIRRALDLPVDRRLVLVSFGGYGVRDLALDRVDCTDGWDVVVTAAEPGSPAVPARVHAVSGNSIYDNGLRYEDLVHAVDVVLTKPGYGILSDCLAGGTAMLYTSRGRFAEYDVFVRDMPRILRCRHLGVDDFRAGRWRDALDALAAQPAPPEQPPTNGADVVAALILDVLSE